MGSGPNPNPSGGLSVGPVCSLGPSAAGASALPSAPPGGPNAPAPLSSGLAFTIIVQSGQQGFGVAAPVFCAETGVTDMNLCSNSGATFYTFPNSLQNDLYHFSTPGTGVDCMYGNPYIGNPATIAVRFFVNPDWIYI